MRSTPEREPFISVRNMRFRYPGTDHDVLSIPVLDIEEAGLVAITGPSGAGKSTLVELMAGTLREPYEGSLRVLGQEWRELRRDRPRQIHLRRIGLIPQDLGLLPGRTPRQMLQRALLDARTPRKECDQRIAAALASVGLEPQADRRIAELSGGQKQRVAIARALARRVDILIADEPTANLNSELADEIMAMLLQIGDAIPVLLVTHDDRIAAVCNRRIALPAPIPAAAPALVPVLPPRHRRLGIMGSAGVAGAMALGLVAFGAIRPHGLVAPQVTAVGGAGRAGSQPQDQTPAQAARAAGAAGESSAAQPAAAAQAVPEAATPAQRAPDASAAWKATPKVASAVPPASANQFAQQAPLIMIPPPSQSSRAAAAPVNAASQQTFGGLNGYLQMWQAISQLSASPFYFGYFGQPRVTAPVPAPKTNPTGSQTGYPDPRLREP
ncbi:MAG TPA: ATP-binding cassette domain-containing protein [Actinomycetota bacterium]|nr:ATP-binding cassette domain-containing protein [Actinomycetota bacterium]